MPRRFGEADADLRGDGDLIERVDDHLDRVFDRDDVDLGRRDRSQRGVERRRLSATGRPGDEDEAVRAREETLGHLQLAVEHAQLGQIAEERARVEDAEDELFPERDRDCRNPHFDFALAPRCLDASVLRAALLGDVEACERLDPRDHRGVNHLGQGVDVVQHAVDPHADARVLAARFDVNIARALVERVVEQVFHRGDDVAVARFDFLDPIELDVSLEVADVDAAAGLLFRGVDRAAKSVEVGDETLNVARGRHDQLRMAADMGLERLDQSVVEGVGHGDGHGVLVGPDDERSVSSREGTGQELGGELRVDLQRVEIDERKAHVLR